MSNEFTMGNFNSLRCPVCVGTGVNFLRQAFDDRYGHPDLFNLVRCTHCGHVMTSPMLCDSDLGTLYSSYYPRKQVNVEALRREALRTLSHWAPLWRWCVGTDNQGQYSLRPGESMLDIGCGSGLSLLEAKALGGYVTGIEADPNVRRIADELGLRIHIGTLQDEPFASEKFDLVVLNQVIEHVPDPALTLVQLRLRLKSDGRIVLVFPNVESFWRRCFGESWINWHVPYHLHHFSRGGFALMALRLGYEVQSVRTITPNLWTILQIRASQSRVKPGELSSIWTVPSAEVLNTVIAAQLQWSFGRVLRALSRRALLLGLMLPITFVNRFVDVLGLGDSVMVEIKPAVIP